MSTSVACGAGRTDLDQEFDVARVARNHDVRLQPLDCHDPAQLAGKITMLALGEDAVQGLAVGETGCFRPSGRLGKFLFDREQREAGFEPPDRVNIGGRRGATPAAATGRAVQRATGSRRFYSLVRDSGA